MNTIYRARCSGPRLEAGNSRLVLWLQLRTPCLAQLRGAASARGSVRVTWGDGETSRKYLL